MFKVIAAGAMLVVMCAAGEAQAKGGGGGKMCKPGQTFQQCYAKCIARSGAAGETEMGRCSNKCAKRGCQ
jgi:hypothetical protein